MEKYLEQMAEVMEEDVVNPSDEITSFEAWDSLTSLSIIVLAEDEYGVTLSSNDILEGKTVEGLYNLIQSRKNNGV